MRVEHFMTKEEILEAYLNIIPYGRNASGRNIAGIETAAEGIFGIKASEFNFTTSSLYRRNSTSSFHIHTVYR